MTTPTKDVPVRSVPARAETRADVTDRIAREIITEEAEYRRSLTERLRAARLKFEAQKAAPPVPAKPRARKTTVKTS